MGRNKKRVEFLNSMTFDRLSVKLKKIAAEESSKFTRTTK